VLEYRNSKKPSLRYHSLTPMRHYSDAIMLAMTQQSDETPLARELKLLAGVRIKVSEPLARHTSMKVGGPADFFIEVSKLSAMPRLLQTLNRYRTDFCLLGNGSNVLVSDRGVRGAVLHLAGEFKRNEWCPEGEIAWVEVGAAYPVTQLVRVAARKGYSGLEFAEGIPGTMGGALFMNAGAYGCEFEKIIDQVDGFTREGEPIRFSRKEMTFSYRDSHLPEGMVVAEVRLRLQREDSAQVSSRVRELVAKRKAGQPSGYPNSGSMFRNPHGDFAGRLIEAAGLKGKTIGDAQISQRHANFIVNLGRAKAEDIRQLMELARAEVRARFDIELEPEVHLLGEWSVQ
jgi:UDP-N-acetylmuramate dehydrogenase